MNQNNIIKLAGTVKPPARKSEIIEALAIRKREQIIAENKALYKELEQLNTKLQVVAAEEMAANGKPKHGVQYYCRADKMGDGSIRVGQIQAEYTCEPSQEMKRIAKRIYELRRMNLTSEPSLHEVRQQVRAAVSQHTPPERRVKQLLTYPESQKMLDAVLGALDKKPLALTA